MALLDNTPDNQREYVSPKQIEAEDRMDLQECMESGRQVTAKAVRYFREEDDTWVILQYGRSKLEIWVPVEEWLQNIPDSPVFINPWDRQKVKPEQWVETMVSSMLTGSFRVIITGLDDTEDRPRFTGSRVMAMDEDRRRVFFPLTPDGEIDYKRTAKPGDEIPIRIVNVRKRNVKVQAGGIEVDIPCHEMAWIFPADCQTRYRPGQMLHAMIVNVDIHVDETGQDGTVDLELSVKQLEPMNNKAINYAEGDIVTGNLITHLEHGMIFSLAGEVTCFVPFNKRFTRPMSGQECIIKITKIEEAEDGSARLSGIIKSKTLYSERDR